MTIDLTRWVRRFIDGGVAFIPPEGPEVGAIRVIDRGHEVHADEALAAAATAFDGCRVTGGDHFDTIEGEAAFLGGLVGEVEGRAVQQSLGLVLTERSHREIRAVIAGEERFEAFHELARRLVGNSLLGLGAVRRRRFRHEAPPGWRRVERGLIHEWYPSDPTEEGSTMWVLPAKPRNEDARGVALDQTLHEPTLSALIPTSVPWTRRVHSRHGLAGELTTVDGAHPGRPTARWSLATFSDSRFCYSVVLESRGGVDHAMAFERVWSSVAPVATPRRQVEATPFHHFCD